MLVRMGKPWSGTSFRYLEGATAVFAIGPQSAGYANDADGIMLVSQVEAAGTNALGSLTTAVSGGAVSVAQNERYLKPGEVVWVAAGGASPTWDVPGATQVAVYIEATGADANGQLTVSGTPTFAMDTSKIPTVAVAAAVNMRRLNGVLTNTLTGDTISFVDCFIDSAHALQIDTLDPRSVKPTSGGTFFGEPRFSQPAGVFPLRAGAANGWTITAAATVDLSYAARYRV
jgi:hypothetical protein